MHYNIVLFGVKDTTEEIVKYIENNVAKIDLIVTIDSNVSNNNHISGYKGLSYLSDEYGIGIYESKSYNLKDDETKHFFANNTFDIGISMGWQRLIPAEVLNVFKYGIYGFHGSCGYLPYGRGRSPLNWSVINGDTRFVLNLFRYDENADSPNVFLNEMFSITEHDSIRTLQYKNMIVSKRLIKKLIDDYRNDNIKINNSSKDFDTWYNKRTPEDGKISFEMKTRTIYNLVRGVTHPFPGAKAICNGVDIVIWEVKPFDEMLDFSDYKVGEIIDKYDDNLIVRTVDGSLLVTNYETDVELKAGDILS